MAKGKGKRRNKSTQGRQTSPSKNAAPKSETPARSTSPEISPDVSPEPETVLAAASARNNQWQNETSKDQGRGVDQTETPELVVAQVDGHSEERVQPPAERGDKSLDSSPATIRRVSARVAQFEEAAQSESLLKHERQRSDPVSPLTARPGAKPLTDVEPIDVEPVGPEPMDSEPVDATLMNVEPVETRSGEVVSVGENSAAAEPPVDAISDAAPLESDLQHRTDEIGYPADTKPAHEQPASVSLHAISPASKLPSLGPPIEDISPLSSPEPTIPQRSIARKVEPELAQTFAATRQPVMVARPVMLENVEDSQDYDDLGIDPDSYFDSPDDVIVTAASMRRIDSPEVPQGSQFSDNLTSGTDFDWGTKKQNSLLDSALAPAFAPDQQGPGHNSIGSTTSVFEENGEQLEQLRISDSPDRSLVGSHFGSHDYASSQVLSKNSNGSVLSLKSTPLDSGTSNLHLETEDSASGLAREDSFALQSQVDDARPNDTSVSSRRPSPARASAGIKRERRLPPAIRLSPQSSPTASPRAYKYVQSPVPKPPVSAEPPIIGVCVVGFHHQRGPEVEYWVGPDQTQSEMWPYLPFQSLPDGSHQFEENVTYFMLLYDRNRHAATSLTFDRDDDGHIRQGSTDFRNVTTLFAAACSRQTPLSELTVNDDEQYTRSTVQKSVVVIASKPLFGPIKDKLTVVTRSYFAQKNFSDRAIIDHFYENLVQMPLWNSESDLNVGMNLQKCVHDLGRQVLILLKAMLLETKILFYASDTDVLGTTQFALASLIPNLINHLEDSGSPLLSSYELNLQRPSFLRSSDRQSLLTYMGLPLQIFAGGGLFSPFVPLQQFDDLKQPETQYGMMGTTNKLFLSKDLDFDVVVNVETSEVTVQNPEVAALLQLTDADKAFINSVKKAVDKAWDTEERWQPQALGYYGGEDYIRHEFEEYLMALLASAKYEDFEGSELPFAPHPLQQYGGAWSERWLRTNNYRIFSRSTDEMLFDLVDPVHPGVKHQKPSGMDRFLGFFKGSNTKRAELAQSSSESVNSRSSSAPHTPSVASSERFGDQAAPATPATPRRWFWQSDTPKQAAPAQSPASPSKQKPSQSLEDALEAGS